MTTVGTCHNTATVKSPNGIHWCDSCSPKNLDFLHPYFGGVYLSPVDSTGPVRHCGWAPKY